MVPKKSSDDPKPQPARIVETVRGREVRSPKTNHLLGVFNDDNQLVIKRGDELVLVELPTN